MPKVIDEIHVFKAVIQCLVGRGYDRATTAEMAAAAGINEATLFRKYGSKVRLVERAVQHLLSNAPLSQVRYTGDMRADLHAILGAYVATADEFGEIVPMILLEIPRYPELSMVIQVPLANIQLVADILARYQEDGLLKKEPPLTSVNALLAPILMDQMTRRVQIELQAPAIDVAEYVECFIEGRGR